MMIYFINMLYIYIFLLDTEKVVRAHHIIKKFWSRKKHVSFDWFIALHTPYTMAWTRTWDYLLSINYTNIYKSTSIHTLWECSNLISIPYIPIIICKTQKNLYAPITPFQYLERRLSTFIAFGLYTPYTWTWNEDYLNKINCA